MEQRNNGEIGGYQRLIAILVVTVLIIAVPVMAHSADQENRTGEDAATAPWNHMMPGHMWAGSGMMWFGALFWLGIWILIVLGIIYLVKILVNQRNGG